MILASIDRMQQLNTKRASFRRLALTLSVSAAVSSIPGPATAQGPLPWEEAITTLTELFVTQAPVPQFWFEIYGKSMSDYVRPDDFEMLYNLSASKDRRGVAVGLTFAHTVDEALRAANNAYLTYRVGQLSAWDWPSFAASLGGSRLREKIEQVRAQDLIWVDVGPSTGSYLSWVLDQGLIEGANVVVIEPLVELQLAWIRAQHGVRIIPKPLQHTDPSDLEELGIDRQRVALLTDHRAAWHYDTDKPASYFAAIERLTPVGSAIAFQDERLFSDMGKFVVDVPFRLIVNPSGELVPIADYVGQLAAFRQSAAGTALHGRNASDWFHLHRVHNADTEPAAPITDCLLKGPLREGTFGAVPRLLRARKRIPRNS